MVKKTTKKDKKQKDDENIAEPKESKPKFVAPLYNRPMKPAGVITPEMRKYINFALTENKNIHMYDENLRNLQGATS